MEELDTKKILEIRQIISKLIRLKKIDDLSREEISNLSEFAGMVQADNSIEPAKTLFSWILDNLIKFDKYAAVNSLIDISLFDGIVNNESKKGYSGFPSGETLCTLLTRSDLIKIINESLHLREYSLIDHLDKIKGAICLIGMAGLKEFEKDLIDICLKKEDEDDVIFKTFGHDILASAFISLIILESKAVEAICVRLKSHFNESIQKALLFYYDIFPQRIPDEDINNIHDHFIENDDALVFSNLAFEVFSDDLNGLNTLIANNSNETKSDFIWEIICPVVHSYKNKKLFQTIIEDNDPRKVHRVLLSAILRKAKWILPSLMKKINSRDKKSAADNLNEILPYYIISAGALSKENCDWLKPFFSSQDEAVKVSAILASIGKEQTIKDLIEMKNCTEALTSVAVEFALALAQDSPVVYLDSLIIEMELSGLDPGLLPFVYCLLKSASNKIPPELEDIWYMAGPYDRFGSMDFYGAYPYRLIGWLFPNKRKRPLPNFVTLEDDIAERSSTILFEIADIRYAGLLKSLLYNVEIEPMGLLILSKLIELEQKELTIETKTLKKIYLSERNKPLVFEKSELFYAIIFYFNGKLNRKSEIISGINYNSEIIDTFLRLIIDTGESDVSDTAIDNSLKQKDSAELLIRGINRIEAERFNEPIDKILLCRLITTDSFRYKSGIINSYCKAEFYGDGKFLSGKSQLNDEEIHLLLYLFEETLTSTMEASLEALASHIENVNWLKSSINRWFGFKNRVSNYPAHLTEAAVRVAGIIKSEEYLMEFVRLASQDDLYSAEKERYLNIIEGIFKKNPESKLIMLRADNPDNVKKAYNCFAKREYSIDCDDKSECIKLISIALIKKMDLDLVKDHVGRTVSINHEKDPIDQSLIDKCLTKAEFEKIAMYLSVTYTDEDSCLVFAEVMDPENNEPSAEILNAILQERDFALFTVSWS